MIIINVVIKKIILKNIEKGSDIIKPINNVPSSTGLKIKQPQSERVGNYMNNVSARHLMAPTYLYLKKFVCQNGR